MNPQEDHEAPEVIRLQPIQERKRSRGFSDNRESDDFVGEGTWERSVDSPVSTEISTEGDECDERAWGHVQSLSPTSPMKINDG